LDGINASREVSRKQLFDLKAAGRLPGQSEIIEGVRATQLYQRNVEVELSGQLSSWNRRSGR